MAVITEKFQVDFQPSLNLENQLINQLIWVSLIVLSRVLALFSRSSFPKKDKDEHEKL